MDQPPSYESLYPDDNDELDCDFLNYFKRDIRILYNSCTIF